MDIFYTVDILILMHCLYVRMEHVTRAVSPSTSAVRGGSLKPTDVNHHHPRATDILYETLLVVATVQRNLLQG